MFSPKAGRNDVEPFGTNLARCPVVVCLQSMKGGLYLGAATGANLLSGLIACSLRARLSSRQAAMTGHRMLAQLGGVAFGCRASASTIGIAFSHCISSGGSNSPMRIFKSQLAHLGSCTDHLA